MLKNIFIFLIFISTLVQAVPTEENITEYRIKQLEENIAVLKIQNEDLLKNTYKLESQIEILDNKYKEEKENYKNLLANNESIYYNQLTAFNLILFLVGAILVFISIVGYNNIKKKIDSIVEEKINEKANEKIEELEVLTKRHDKIVCEHENILENLKSKSPENLTDIDKKMLDEKVKELLLKENKSDEEWSLIGLEYLQKSLFEDAVNAYQQAIKLNPENSTYYANLGYSLNELKRFTEAIDYLKKAIELNPNSDMAHNNLGFSISHTSQEDSLEHYFNALKVNPNNAKAYSNIGYTYNCMGNYDKATTYNLKAIDLDPKDYITYNNLAVSYENNEKYEEAVKFYKKSIEINPQYSMAITNLKNLEEKLEVN